MRLTALGQEAAFEQLYDAFAARVFGLARRIVRDPSQAEEVAQEVFLEIWRRASRFDSAQGLGDVLDHDVDACQVGRPGALRAGGDRPRAQGRAGVDRAGRGQRGRGGRVGFERKAVQRCLGTLTELQRESITLAYYSGYTYREVAELLTAPLPTIKTRLRDGLIRLRDCLGVAT